MQMEALNCLQAQTLGRSWQSNREEARPTSHPASSAVQRKREPLFPWTCRRNMCVQHQFALELMFT